MTKTAWKKLPRKDAVISIMGHITSAGKRWQVLVDGMVISTHKKLDTAKKAMLVCKKHLEKEANNG